MKLLSYVSAESPKHKLQYVIFFFYMREAEQNRASTPGLGRYVYLLIGYYHDIWVPIPYILSFSSVAIQYYNELPFLTQIYRYFCVFLKKKNFIIIILFYTVIHSYFL